MTHRSHVRRVRCLLVAALSAATVLVAPGVASASTAAHASAHHGFKLHGTRDPYSRIKKAGED
jgi:hypothetical protein